MTSAPHDGAKRRLLGAHDLPSTDNFDSIDVAARLGRLGPPPFLHPRRLPIRTTIAAVSLLIIGVVFSISGLVVFLKSTLNDALPFLIIGVIGFIPGSYNSWILYQAYMGVQGFDYSQVPSYDE